VSALGDRAGAVDTLLREYPDLPQPRTVDLRDDTFTVGVRAQLADVAQVVAWALRFDAPVTVTEKSTYVAVATVISVYGVDITAWTTLRHTEAFHLLQRWGYDLTPEGVSIPAAHAYALSSAP
jgi:hypothetical protein